MPTKGHARRPIWPVSLGRFALTLRALPWLFLATWSTLALPVVLLRKLHPAGPNPHHPSRGPSTRAPSAPSRRTSLPSRFSRCTPLLTHLRQVAQHPYTPHPALLLFAPAGLYVLRAIRRDFWVFPFRVRRVPFLSFSSHFRPSPVSPPRSPPSLPPSPTLLEVPVALASSSASRSSSVPSALPPPLAQPVVAAFSPLSLHSLLDPLSVFPPLRPLGAQTAAVWESWGGLGVGARTVVRVSPWRCASARRALLHRVVRGLLGMQAVPAVHAVRSHSVRAGSRAPDVCGLRRCRVPLHTSASSVWSSGAGAPCLWQMRLYAVVSWGAAGVGRYTPACRRRPRRHLGPPPPPPLVPRLRSRRSAPRPRLRAKPEKGASAEGGVSVYTHLAFAPLLRLSFDAEHDETRTGATSRRGKRTRGTVRRGRREALVLRVLLGRGAAPLSPSTSASRSPASAPPPIRPRPPPQPSSPPPHPAQIRNPPRCPARPTSKKTYSRTRLRRPRRAWGVVGAIPTPALAIAVPAVDWTAWGAAGAGGGVEETTGVGSGADAPARGSGWVPRKEVVAEVVGGTSRAHHLRRTASASCSATSRACLWRCSRSSARSRPHRWGCVCHLPSCFLLGLWRRV
ncbi:hypothetical protein B0H10DRAFT_2442691 [Mycena sp. CBHHK59/15]|nr:hypothetical protein B0H10DRAFT_2442691 [Mycena sp. CBHHK59/15]